MTRTLWIGLAVATIAGCWVLFGPAAPVTLAAGATQEAETPPEMRSVWDGVYTVDQARRGRAVFRDECSSCHNVDEFDAGYGTVYDLFASKDSMPETDPGALEDQAYVDLIAYILRSTDRPAGEEELPADPELLKTISLLGDKPSAP